MQSVTVQIDESIVKEVQNVASRNDTTLDAMVRDYLASVAKETQQEREHAAKEFQRTVRKFSKPMGKRDWTRDDLYDRPGLL